MLRVKLAHRGRLTAVVTDPVRQRVVHAVSTEFGHGPVARERPRRLTEVARVREALGMSGLVHEQIHNQMPDGRPEILVDRVHDVNGHLGRAKGGQHVFEAPFT